PARIDAVVREALGEVDPAPVYLDPAEPPEDPVAAARAAGASLLLVASSALPGGTVAPPSDPQDPAVLLLLDGTAADPGAAERPGEVPHLALPASRGVLVAVLRALLAAHPRQAPVRARAPGAGSAAALYEAAIAEAETALRRARAGEGPDLGSGRLLAERLHTHLLAGNALLNRSLEPHPPGDLARHCAGVAVIAGRIALGLAWETEDVLRVIQAGLVHDIGMVRLPAGLLADAGTWSPEDRRHLQRHPELGARLLLPDLPRAEWLHEIVLQEHERRGGQGYPQGLRGDAIVPGARVIAVADVFEALSHPRTYRSPFTLLEALEQVAGMTGEWFDPAVVTALVNEISAFPLDSYVQLSTGEIARVTATNPDNLFRPRVLVTWDGEWRRVEPPRPLDLAERGDVRVARALLENELPLT
ncbi:MAG: HD domain-containing protein, partial [Gemmatimonadota bacterium]|nr:HD domain-containing protein [Gemmatimonadota bacterium]